MRPEEAMNHPWIVEGISHKKLGRHKTVKNSLSFTQGESYESLRSKFQKGEI